ncbi:flagellar basal body-associated FliL family protein [Aliikangiella sp. IMCC44653]
MANDDQDLEIDVGGDGEAAKGGKGKLIIIIAAVLLIGGGAAAFFLMGGDETPPAAEGAADGEAAAAAAPAPGEPKEKPIYIGVPNAITANLPGKPKNRTVQIKMVFMVRGSDAQDAVKQHMPQLKNDVLMLISQQTVEDVKVPDGRIKLQEKALETIQATLTELVGKPTVEKVLFVSFVMQ